MASKTTYYRRLRRARELGCAVEDLPDLRGKHDNHPKGPKHYRWNTGKILSEDGYVKVRVGIAHPLADSNGYAYEHLIVWVSAGNSLPGSGELIHHKDENKENNRLDNLELKTKSSHNSIHISDRNRDEKGRLLPIRYDLELIRQEDGRLEWVE